MSQRRDPKNKKSGATKRHHKKLIDEQIDRDKSMSTKSIAGETVDQFIKRGGNIKKYAYKWPPKWKMTFNGFSKYDKR